MLFSLPRQHGSAFCSSVGQRTSLDSAPRRWRQQYGALQCVVVYCSVLQCLAVSCCVLQCILQLGRAAHSSYLCSATLAPTARCVAVCCSVLQSVVVRGSVLQCVAVCCSVLQCVAVSCSVLQCGALSCSALQCVAVCCSALQCVAVRCSALQGMLRSTATLAPTARCVAVCCSVLQYAAVCCSALQCVAVRYRVSSDHPWHWRQQCSTSSWCESAPDLCVLLHIRAFVCASFRCARAFTPSPKHLHFVAPTCSTFSRLLVFILLDP